MAISRSRVAARESMRLATLAHAMRSTAATAPSIIQSAVRSVLPMTCCRSGTTFTPYPSCPGYCWTIRLAIVVMSARARSSGTPGRSRPTAPSQKAKRCCRLSLSIASGIQTSVAAVGNAMPFGMTPMIVRWRPLSSTERPMTPGSAPNCRVHNPWLITTTASRPSTSSSGV